MNRILLWTTLLVLILSATSLTAQDKETSSKTAVDAEINALYKADQDDRISGAAKGQELMRRDEQRRAKVLEIYRAGGLDSAEDFYQAAMILQHSKSQAHS